MQAEAKAAGADPGSLEKRAAELDREVGRLVKAIRTIDAAELAEELQIVRAERDRLRAELDQADKYVNPLDLDAEAERIADTIMDLGERLTDADPAVLREVLHQFVSRITCRWEKSKGENRAHSRLVGGTVELREQTPFSVYGAVVQATRRPPATRYVSRTPLQDQNRITARHYVLLCRKLVFANVLPVGIHQRGVDQRAPPRTRPAPRWCESRC